MFSGEGGQCGIDGEVEVVTDEKLKQELWQDWFVEHSSRWSYGIRAYVLLKFTANHATYWIEEYLYS